MKDNNCIFCKIANGEIPSRTLYEDEKYRVILDLGPATRGHALVLPKDHFANIYEIPAEWAAGAIEIGQQMALRMRERLHTDGANLIQNNGEAAGQTVPHFHLHVIPRYRNDGQHMLWRPGSMTDAELDEVLEALT
ncbi:MAG: HIT family protein [Eubacteriales bacterium]|nr:HIT family protein [Eubacteriales bacterium]